jgi:ABC-type branched-subunit amino acid transport system substrate-binding protein
MRIRGLRRGILVGAMITLVAVIAPMLYGCTAPTTGPSPSDTPIKIGAPVPLTGYMASDGFNMRDGIILAVEDLNSAGGLVGRPVEAIFFDSKELTSETAVLSADYLITQEKCDVIVTGYFDEPGTDVYGKYDPPMIHGPGSYECLALLEQNQSTNVFLMGLMGDTQAKEVIDGVMVVAEAAGYEWPNKKMAILNGPWPWSVDHKTGAREKAAELGWEVVNENEVALETREWGGILAGIRANEPAFIYMEAWDAGCLSSFDTQLQDDPWNVLIAHGQAALIPDYIEMTGTETNGVLAGNRSGGIPSPETLAWRERFEQRFGREPGLTEADWTFDMVMLWAAAVERVGDPSDYAAVCQSIKDNPYDALAGRLNFNADEWSVDYQAASPIDQPAVLLQVQNGKWVELAVGDTMLEGVSFQVPPWIE